MNQRFNHAIVRTPCRNMVNGLSSAGLVKPDYELALKQYEQYIKVLSSCGLAVEVLEADENYPDSCFIEDVALCTPHCAIITRPGAVSRRGEIDSMHKVLEKYYANIESIIKPGTIEAGDIMTVGDRYFIGLSDRTNQAGADQLIAILEKYGMEGTKVTLEKVLHLKTGVAYLENNNMLVSGEFISKTEFQPYHLIEVPADEAYAANSIWVNATVIIPEGFPVTQQLIKKAGFAIIEVNVSEFQKLDGGLSCLSLRF